MFASPWGCAGGAIGVKRALVSQAWPAGESARARMGIDSGEASRTAAGRAGLEARREARVGAVARRGQVVSAAAAGLVAGSLPAGVGLAGLGRHRLRDGGRAEQILQVEAGGLPAACAPLRSLVGARQC